MRPRTIVLSLAAAVVLLAVGAAAILSQIDLGPYYRGVAIDKVAEATGRKLSINGEMKLKLLPALALTVKDVAFANPDWVADRTLIKAGEVSVQIALRPLLFGGKLRIDRLLLEDVDLHLVTDGKGRGNWQFTPTAPPPESRGGEAPPLAGFGDIVLRNIAITYHDGRTGKTTMASLKEVSATASAAGPVAIKASANYQGLPIEVSATTGSVSALMTPGTPFAIDADIGVSGLTAKLIGSVAEPVAGRGMNIAVTLQSPNSEGLGALLGVALPPKPFRFAATVIGDADGTIAIKALQASLGASAISGEAALVMGGPRPQFSAALDAPLIDLTEAPNPDAPTAAHSGNDGQVFSNDPLPLSSLGMVDGNVTLKAAIVKSQSFTLQALSAHVTLADHDLLLHRFDFDLDGAHIGGNGELSTRQRPAALAIEFEAKHLDLGKILSQLSGKPLLDAKGDLAVTVHGKGDSLHSLMGTLDGTSNLVVGRGTIKNRYAELVGADVFREAFAWAQGKQDSKLTCMVSRFDLHDGLATSRALLVDTSDVTIAGKGTVNLGSEQLDLELLPRPKETSLLSLATPIDIGGSFTQPTIQPNQMAMAKDVAKGVVTWINPLFALVPMILDQGDDKNPCLAALAPGKPAPEKKEGGISGAVKGFGRSLGDIFK